MKGSEKKKIEELFVYRKLPYLLSYLPKKKAKKLYKKLVRLQYEIYSLDTYLENNWVLKKKKLKKYWNGIYFVLDDLGYSKRESHEMLSHIRRYQKHESQLREGIMPTILNEEYYYHFKSCDVRLMREIIYKSCPKISENLTFEDWRYFDLVTEINDDVEDVFEDQGTINGNMFLIAIIESGISNTEKRFINFINNLEEKAFKMLNETTTNEDNKKKIYKWTLKEVKTTKKLIKHNLARIASKGLEDNIPLVKFEALTALREF